MKISVRKYGPFYYIYVNNLRYGVRFGDIDEALISEDYKFWNDLINPKK